MRTIRDILRDADPLRHEPHPREGERDRLRQAVVTAASDVTTPSPTWFRTRVAPLLITALLVAGIVSVGSGIWSQGGGTLRAAIGFEVRLAEDQPGSGLREARIGESARSVHLHQDVIVSNSDIAQGSVVTGDVPSRFGVAVRFNAAGAEKMRRATATHVGRPVAILIDDAVVAAPVLTGPISTSAVISGNYTRTEAERIVRGIRIP